MEVDLGPGDFVFDGDRALPRKRNSPTQFLAHVYYGQTAGWIKMPLGTAVNLGPCDVVLDGVAAAPAPPQKKGAQPPVFGPCLLWPDGWLDEDAGSRPRPRPDLLDGDPAPPAKGAQQPPFSAHIYSGHGRPSQLLLSSFFSFFLLFVYLYMYYLVSEMQLRINKQTDRTRGLAAAEGPRDALCHAAG